MAFESTITVDTKKFLNYFNNLDKVAAIMKGRLSAKDYDEFVETHREIRKQLVTNSTAESIKEFELERLEKIDGVTVVAADAEARKPESIIAN